LIVCKLAVNHTFNHTFSLKDIKHTDIKHGTYNNIKSRAWLRMRY
jgi:hypothetical protein